ncbi:hypothetical protein EKO29_02980 [Colwellia sp. Arc7-635]|uniref:hypothetical protein n=1 Tax=Colwellia sp. Arc7-635 TaxID=2497879 RepID=UPI000F84EDF5|nr:hypothetical protein [Colwellia sp. Arc7-635]AZQ83110.1 hypothetical protein EKO29_02980 [Colwellia sp. Arc7-635]
MNKIKSWWQTFIYNYRWSDYVNYIDGWIPKLALTIPVLGYLILFNDNISELLVFNKLANEPSLSFGLNGVQRLRLLYFGLLLLGLSNFTYRMKKPYQFKFGTNFMDYSRTCLEIFTLSDYVRMHGNIRQDGHLTISGKYYDSEWDGFKGSAQNTGEGTDNVTRNGDWETAKSKYGSLLREILSETFFKNDIANRGWLTFCIIVSTVGYLLLLAPSVDLFIKVIYSTLLSGGI